MQYRNLIRTLCSLLLFGVLTPAMADSLSQLPAALADRLLPVEEISLDNLDPDAREQLTTARARLARMLDDGLPAAQKALHTRD